MRLREIEDVVKKIGPDAARYQWFKQHLHEPHAIDHFIAFNNWHYKERGKLENLDDAIDKSMEAILLRGKP